MKHTKGELSVSGIVNCRDLLNCGIANLIRFDNQMWGAMTVMDGTSGKEITESQMKANAERISRTWNCHDELVAALKAADKAFRELKYSGPVRDQIDAALEKVSIE